MRKSSLDRKRMKMHQRIDELAKRDIKELEAQKRREAFLYASIMLFMFALLIVAMEIGLRRAYP